MIENFLIMSALALTRFIDWFDDRAGFDRSALNLIAIPGQGYGAIAVRDLSVTSGLKCSARTKSSGRIVLGRSHIVHHTACNNAVNAHVCSTATYRRR
jgi:hypothetical protein